MHIVNNVTLENFSLTPQHHIPEVSAAKKSIGYSGATCEMKAQMCNALNPQSSTHCINISYAAAYN
jgi:hypothetical protein